MNFDAASTGGPFDKSVHSDATLQAQIEMITNLSRAPVTSTAREMSRLRND